MQFNYEYCICGMAVTFLLILINLQRQSYFTQHNKVFIVLCIVNYVTAAADLLTCFTISYPESFSTWFLYSSNYLYLIMVTNLAMLFMVYTAQIIKNTRLISLSNVMVTANTILLVLSIATNYYNHNIFWFKDNLFYVRGPLIHVLLIIPTVSVAISTYFFVHFRKQFGSYQIRTVVMAVLFMLFSLFVQLYKPALDIGTFGASLILVAIFVCFEDPAQYTYLSTRCYNHRALLLDIRRRIKYSRTTVCLLVGIINSPDSVYFSSKDDYYAFTSQIASKMFKTFGQRVFAIDGSKYLIFIKTAEKSKEDEVLEKLEQMFSKPVLQRKIEVPVRYCTRSTSLDAVVRSENMANDLIFSLRSSTVEAIFSAADLAALTNGLARERAVAEAINRCVQGSGPDIVFQPIYDVKNRVFHSAEVLCRLNDPVLGYIGPAEFISVAEKNGSIIQIGEQVFRKTCEFAAANAQKCGINLFEVNVSQLQFGKADFASRFIAIAEEYGISPGMINFEFTESLEMLSDPVISNNITKLINAGFEFSIDDYGSGFSAPACLINLPASIVKMDCTLLVNAGEDKDAYIILEKSIELMKQLGKRVVIEGAESLSDVEIAVNTGADFIQGYYYSKPLDSQALISFIS